MRSCDGHWSSVRRVHVGNPRLSVFVMLREYSLVLMIKKGGVMNTADIEALERLVESFVFFRNEADREQLKLEESGTINTLVGKEKFWYYQGEKEAYNRAMFYIIDGFGLNQDIGAACNVTCNESVNKEELA